MRGAGSEDTIRQIFWTTTILAVMMALSMPFLQRKGLKEVEINQMSWLMRQPKISLAEREPLDLLWRTTMTMSTIVPTLRHRLEFLRVTGAVADPKLLASVARSTTRNLLITIVMPRVKAYRKCDMGVQEPSQAHSVLGPQDEKRVPPVIPRPQPGRLLLTVVFPLMDMSWVEVAVSRILPMNDFKVQICHLISSLSGTSFARKICRHELLNSLERRNAKQKRPGAQKLVAGLPRMAPSILRGERM